MLSSENPPPDLSRSCKISLLKDSDEGASSDDNPLESFSIREYVFGRRGKDIGTNWPFSRRSLQLCLIYGVRDVLPPFDPARNPSSAKCAADDNLIGSRKGSSSLNINKSSESPRRSSPDINLFPKKAKPCRLIVKSSNAVSHEPETKVCPVCKAFSSSSNTTLNAHIDQCLSVGGPCMKWHRIKARKTRLMVDIYETALRCTLEDLDTRNGTNWTSTPPDLSSATDVYVDSNGTKLRMLSNLDDLTPIDKLGTSKKQKYLLHGRGIYPPRPECRTYGHNGSDPMVKDGQHEDPQGCKKLGKPHIIASHDQTKSVDAGVLIKQWARSKRSQHPRKLQNISSIRVDGWKNSSFGRAVSSRSRKFSSLRTNLLSVKKTSSVQKHLNSCESEWKDEANEGRMGRACNKPLIDQLRVLRNQKMKVALENAGESVKAFEMSPESISHDPCPNTHNVQIGHGFTRGYEMVDLYQDAFVTFTKSTSSPKEECVVPMFSIPIPGPPGSFLPSPGRTEEHNAHSSLTTCKLQSYEETVNMASSSGSPISLTSKRLHEEKLDTNPLELAPFPVFNYSAEGEYELPTTPVLRLMGKNLMVVNNEKHGPSVPLEGPPVPWSSTTVHYDLSTTDKIHTFRHIFPETAQGMITRDNCISGFEKVPSNFRPLQFYGNSSGVSLISKQIGSNLRVDPYHNVENIRTPKERIEREADNRDFKATQGMANPLNSYQTQGYPRSPFIQNEIKRVAYSEGMMNGNFPKPSTVDHLSSTFSFSPGFSSI